MKTKEKYIHIINELGPGDATPEASANVSFIDGEPEYDEIEEEGLDQYTRSIVDGTKVLLQYLIVGSKEVDGLWDEYAKDDNSKPHFSDVDNAAGGKSYHKKISDNLSSIFPSLANTEDLKNKYFKDIKQNLLNDIKNIVNGKTKESDEYIQFSSNLYDAINDLKNSFNSVVGNPKPYTQLKKFIQSNQNAKSVPENVDQALEGILPDYKEYKDDVRKRLSVGDEKTYKSSYKELYDYLSKERIGRMFVTLMRLHDVSFININNQVPTNIPDYKFGIQPGIEWWFYEVYLEEFIENFADIVKENEKKFTSLSIISINESVFKFQNNLVDLMVEYNRAVDMIKKGQIVGTNAVYAQFNKIKQKVLETYNSLSELLKTSQTKLLELNFNQEPYVKTGLKKLKNDLGDSKKFADFATILLQTFKYDRTGSVIDKQPVVENSMRRKMVIDLNEIKNNSLNESYIRMYKNWVKELLNYFLSGVNIPVVVKGSKKDVASFAKAFGNEAKYMKAIQKYGLDSDKTYSIKSKLDKAIYGFEKETGLKWPFI